MKICLLIGGDSQLKSEGVTATSLGHVCCGQTFVTRVELLNHVRYRHKSNCSSFVCPMSNCDTAMSYPSLLER